MHRLTITTCKCRPHIYADVQEAWHGKSWWVIDTILAHATDRKLKLLGQWRILAGPETLAVSRNAQPLHGCRLPLQLSLPAPTTLSNKASRVRMRDAPGQWLDHRWVCSLPSEPVCLLALLVQENTHFHGLLMQVQMEPSSTGSPAMSTKLYTVYTLDPRVPFPGMWPKELHIWGCEQFLPTGMLVLYR